MNHLLAQAALIGLGLANMLGFYWFGFGIWPRSWLAFFGFGFLTMALMVLREAVEKEKR